jgi:pyruvyltransferase
MSESVYAFWCRIPSRANFGDALTPWIIERVTGHYPLFARPEWPVEKYFVTGSIVEYAREHCTVWGAGIIASDDRVCSKATLLAVRGPLTRARALECETSCPEVYGDPALLLPRFYRPQTDRRPVIGILPHFSDQACVAAGWQGSDEMRLIDIQSSVESVIEQINSCELIISSSLHGLIAGHAYGVPAVWAKFKDLPSGDDTKFYDYFLSVGQERPEPVRLAYRDINPDRLAQHARRPVIDLDLERLWQACPFRRSQ